MALNIRKFANKFNDMYNFLYDNYDRVAGYDEAVDAFDGFAKTHGDFVRDFVKYRGDFISSDREAAAFILALDSMI